MSNSISPGIPPYQKTEISILEDPYHKEVQEDIWQHKRKKTMHALLTNGFVLLVSNMIGYATVNALELANLLEIILVPTIFIGLGFFALLQPLFAAVTGILVIVALTIVNLIAVGPISLLAGSILKVVALYFIITSIRHAREAEKARKELERLK